jgi:uncharacterized DUF497 family protein
VDSKAESDWDSGNIEYVARHGVNPSEAEEAISNHPVILATVLSSGEARTVCAGRTSSGRMLKVVYTFRAGRIRVVTAHEDRKLRSIL